MPRIKRTAQSPQQDLSLPPSLALPLMQPQAPPSAFMSYEDADDVPLGGGGGGASSGGGAGAAAQHPVATRTFSPDPPEFLTTFRTDRTALSVWCIGGVITMLENHVQCVGSVRLLALCVMDPATGGRTDVFRDVPVFVQDRSGWTPDGVRDALQHIKTVCAQWRYVRDKPLYKELQHKARAITLKHGTHTVGTMDTAPHITFTLQSDKYLTMHLRLEWNRGVGIPTQLTCRPPPNPGERAQEPVPVWASGYDRDMAAGGGGFGGEGGGPVGPWNVVV